jgi:hypothetical protein
VVSITRPPHREAAMLANEVFLIFDESWGHVLSKLEYN